MVTQMEITAYVEAMRRVEADAAGDYWQPWERRLAIPREKELDLIEWYREYEEETGTLLGCD
jgi:hypothetical protein